MDKRHNTAAEILREVTARFVQQEANTDPLITITNVRMAPNFRRAQILFTTIPDNREKDALAFLQRHGTDLRNFIKKEARLKFIPHIDFAVDHGERHRQHIDSIVVDLNLPTDTDIKS